MFCFWGIWFFIFETILSTLKVVSLRILYYTRRSIKNVLFFVAWLIFLWLSDKSSMFNLLDIPNSGTVLWIWLCSLALPCWLIPSSISPFTMQNLKNGVTEFWSKKVREPDFWKNSQKWLKYEGFFSREEREEGVYKNLIYSCVLFSLDYKITNGLLSFCKNHMYKTILVRTLWWKTYRLIRM